MKRTAIVILGILLLAGAGYEAWRNSLHVVIPGKVYRSGQLPPGELDAVIKAKHIKSVLNMRGPNPTRRWYQQEMAATKAVDAKHYDLAFSSYRLPSKKKLQRLVFLLAHAPKPILIHCLGGSDRSGIASAIALILFNNATLQQSEHQFSFYYFVVSSHSVGKLVFARYRAWLAKHHLAHNRRHFLKWIDSRTS